MLCTTCGKKKSLPQLRLIVTKWSMSAKISVAHVYFHNCATNYNMKPTAVKDTIYVKHSDI